MDDQASVRTKRVLPLACALAALFLFTLGSSQRGLWNPDEPREAAIAREMWLRGDAVVPHLNGQAFLEKPPLYAWVSCLAFAVRGGPDAVGARAGSNLAGAALVGLTVRLALTAMPPAQAALAGAALASTPLFYWHSSRANLDVPLALFTALALAGFYRAWRRSHDAAGSGRYHHPALDAATLAVALGMLTKGIVGLALPVLIAATFLLLERDLGFLRRLRWVRLTGLLAVPVLCWLVPFALRDGGALAHSMFVKHHLQRYLMGFDHQHPWWHYLATVPTSTLPWLALAVPAVRIVPETTPASASLSRLCLAWVLAPLAFFSLSAAKRDLYMLPSFPAIALLVGLAASSGKPSGRAPRAASLMTGLAALAIAAGLGTLAPEAVAAALDHVRTSVPGVLPALGAAWMLGGAVLLAAAARALPGRVMVAAACAPALLTAALALALVLPAIDPLKSARGVLPLVASSDDLVGYQLREPDLGLLTFPRRAPLWIASYAEDLPVLLREGKRIVGSASVLLPALAIMPVKWREVAASPAGSDRFIVVELDPADAPSRAASGTAQPGRKVALHLRSMVH